MQKVFFWTFSYAENIIQKNLKFLRKLALNMVMSRPKLEIPRQSDLHLRLLKFEFEKIARVAKEKNLTKTEAILQGIDLLEKNKPKKNKPKILRSQLNQQKNIQPKFEKNSVGLIEGETIMFNKN